MLSRQCVARGVAWRGVVRLGLHGSWATSPARLSQLQALWRAGAKPRGAARQPGWRSGRRSNFGRLQAARQRSSTTHVSSSSGSSGSRSRGTRIHSSGVGSGSGSQPPLPYLVCPGSLLMCIRRSPWRRCPASFCGREPLPCFRGRASGPPPCRQVTPSQLCSAWGCHVPLPGPVCDALLPLWLAEEIKRVPGNAGLVLLFVRGGGGLPTRAVEGGWLAEVPGPLHVPCATLRCACWGAAWSASPAVAAAANEECPSAICRPSSPPTPSCPAWAEPVRRSVPLWLLCTPVAGRQPPAL
jgi:hypothetical protein